MMTTEHDEALVERVALALARTVDTEIPDDWANYSMSHDFYTDKARAVIYPPTPPKTRLQVARELVSNQYSTAPDSQKAILSGSWDTDRYMRAVLAALALPAMED